MRLDIGGNVPSDQWNLVSFSKFGQRQLVIFYLNQSEKATENSLKEQDIFQRPAGTKSKDYPEIDNIISDHSFNTSRIPPLGLLDHT